MKIGSRKARFVSTYVIGVEKDSMDGIELARKIAAVTGLSGLNEEAIASKIHIRSDDILLLSGSLVDRSGTPTSDFDLCLIAKSQDDRFSRKTFPRHAHMRYYTDGDRVKASFDYLEDGLYGVDVEYYVIDEVERIIDKHNHTFELLRSRARKFSSFSSSASDSRLLSRLTYAVALTRPDEFADLRRRIDRDKICYTEYRTAVGSFPDFRDLAGVWIQEDFTTGLVLARKLVLDNVRGLTHLHGNTNRNPKYISRFVKRLPRHRAELATSFLELYANDIKIYATAREAILAWLHLLNDVFAAIREDRKDRTHFPSCAEFISMLRTELHSRMNWHVEIENEYAFRANEAVEGMPSPIELLERREPSDDLPFRRWAQTNSETPYGENQKPLMSPTQ